MNPVSETRIIALIHDGDCSDYSCQHLSVSRDFDIEAAKAEYRKWYRDVYSVQSTTGSALAIGYQSLADWLVSHGASWADIEEIDE